MKAPQKDRLNELIGQLRTMSNLIFNNSTIVKTILDAVQLNKICGEGYIN